jgi:hypothetical protein
MSDATPPGQVNYETWFRAAGLRTIVPWACLGQQGREAWEAAAQAVLAMQEETRCGAGSTRQRTATRL